MSKELPNNQKQNEEVDLIVFFNLIGNAISKVLVFLKRIFYGLFSVFISLLRILFINIKLISIVFTVFLIIGFVLDKTKDKVYYANAYVNTHFDSKYELINNIDYYNSLIKLKDFQELSNIFDITLDEAKDLLEFKIEVGPESVNDKLLQYNEFLKSLDSVTVAKTNYDDYIENRNLFSSKIFLLQARAKKYNIFKKLENGLNNDIENTYSTLKQIEQEQILNIEEANLKESLLEVQKLKNTYLDVLETESKKNVISSSLSDQLGFQVEKTTTKEDQILAKELEIYNQLKAINQKRLTNKTLFDNLASFKEKGLLENIWYKKYKFILPILALLLLLLYKIGLTLHDYVINYKYNDDYK